MTFQDLILTLQQYWAKQGCLFWNPWHEAVGAGTCNPATLLRALGPETWNVAYVEPSFRPDDGRFAENPNRMQMHHQFQVILKPIPVNAQELYLGSLFALGIKLEEHDIRFVEDNWESPALGAWGLGWEVWLDGMEVTQYTYFQQAGGLQLDPCACELTYGLERIAMYLQNVSSVWDLQWNESVSYADILKQQEIDYCEYEFNTANVERLRSMYSLFEGEARNCIEKNLPVPGYDYILRCSHTFNLLDSRGAVGLAERVKLFGEMRKLTKQVSELFVAQREQLGFPLRRQYPAFVPTKTVATPAPTTPRTFLFELGVEELASAVCEPLVEQLSSDLRNALAEHRLTHGEVTTYTTPRRIAVVIEALAPQQSELKESVRGPRRDVAEKNVKALEGFCQKNGITPADVIYREDAGVEYAYADVVRPQSTAVEVLEKVLPGLVAKLQSPRNMRWLPGDKVAFNRPIRWFVALHGETVVNFSYAEASSGKMSHRGRYDRSTQIEIRSAEEYLSTLRAVNVIADHRERKNLIRAQIEACASEKGATARITESLLDEVTHIVEYPTAFVGTFADDFTALPQTVLIGVMEKHLRCFALIDSKGAIQPAFIAVRNGYREKIDQVRAGYERVMRARFADAKFFIGRDGEKTLADFRSGLTKLIYHQKLGSMFEKNERLERIVPALLKQIKTKTLADNAVLTRASHLLKADLASQMVTEMSSLQGEMGREYALRSKEPEAVAEAIRDHYYPRYAGDSLPKSLEGAILGLADRLDNLACFFSIGSEPTGTVDPYGLRRDALAVLSLSLGYQLELDLSEVVTLAWNEVPKIGEPDQEKRLARLLEFISKRFEVQLRDDGVRHDIVTAVLSRSANTPTKAKKLATELQAELANPQFAEVLTAYVRCARILNSAREKNLYKGSAIDQAHLVEVAEKELFRVLASVTPKLSQWTVAELPTVLGPAVSAIHAFFDSVMVMAEDEKLRGNRLALIASVVLPIETSVDLTALEV